MRKLAQTSFAVIAVLALSFTFIQCSNAKKKMLDAQVALVNQVCPMQVDEVTTLTGCKSLDGDILEYTYSLSISESELNADFKTTIKEVLKQSLLGNAETKKLLDEGINLRYVYNDKNGKEVYAETFKAEDLK